MPLSDGELTDAQRLAGATKWCSNCKGDGVIDVPCGDHAHTREIVCPDCVDELEGDGRVHVFPATAGVRVACLGHIQFGYPDRAIDCQEAKCPGWTAAAEGWEEQAWSIHLRKQDGFWIGYVTLPTGQVGEVELVDCQPTYRAAFMTALCRAVEAQGWQLMEAESSGRKIDDS